MPQFDASKYISLIFWFILSFSYLVYFIKNKLVPRMDRVLEDRFFKIEKENKKIDSLKQEIEEIRKNNQERLEKAHQDVDLLVQKTKNEIDQDRQEKLKRLDLEIQERIREFDYELKWKMQEIKDQFEHDLKPYTETLQEKIVPMEKKQNVK